MKRFYKNVTVAQAAEGFEIHLDERAVRTPAKNKLVLPTHRLGQTVALEWQRVGDTIKPDEMPVTKLATSVTDLMPQRRHVALDETLAFIETDLLCYHADQPAELVERQHAAWQPWLDWLAARHGLDLQVTTGFAAISPDQETYARARAVLDCLDHWQLVALHSATQITGSIVLGLAILDGKLESQEALAAALLDENYEIERWGEEHEQQKRHRMLARDLDGVVAFVKGLRERG